MDTQHVATFIESVDLKKTPTEVVKRAKLCVMDTVGVMLGGIITKAARIAREISEVKGGKGEASMAGSRKRVPVGSAAFSNCVAASALDMDDGHHLGGHPGGVVVPSGLAVAEAQRASGKTFLESIIAGYEVAIRVQEILNADYIGGANMIPCTGANYHAAGTGDTYGAASAAAKLMGCNPKQTIHALGIAAAHAPCTRSNQVQITGHNVKESMGWAGLAGVESATLAKHGFTGPTTIFDDDRTRPKSASTLGKTYEILNTYFKPYPACRGTHAALDAIIILLRDHHLSSKDISKVHVSKHSISLDFNSLEPVSIEQAQFSFPFLIGSVVVYGDCGPELVAEEKLKDLSILREAKKVSLHREPPYSNDWYSATVTLETKDGKTHKHHQEFPKGDPQNPMSAKELESKYVMLASPVIGKEGAQELVNVIHNLDKVDDMREFTALLNQVARATA